MVMREKDDLSLFSELRENEKTDLNLIQSSDEFEASCGPNHGSGPMFNLSSSGYLKKKHVDEFLNVESEKSDYDWLLTPPDTPTIPALEKEPQKVMRSQAGNPRTCPTALSTRLADSEVEPLPLSNLASENSAGLPTSGALSTHQPSSSGKKTPAGRSSTPTARTSLPSKPKVNMSSRQPTPTSRGTFPSTKPKTAPVRSSTPTRSAPRSSTPTSRLSLRTTKSAPRSSTPANRPASSSTAASASAPPRRSLSATRPAYAATKIPPQSRGTSPVVRSRPRNPSEMPGFSNDAPNLKTGLHDKPVSASRGRKPVGGSNRGNSIAAFGKARLVGDDDVNPVLMGTQMVERVVNMRRLPPPKQDSPVSNDVSRRFSSIGNAGFGRSLSKKSLDMAMRHMDIKQSIQGNIRPLRFGGSTKCNSASASDSLATSSNASTEPSVSNNSHSLSESDLEDNSRGMEQTPFIPTGPNST